MAGRGAGGEGASRRGSVAAELAFVLPLLMFLTLICVDYGRYTSTYLAVQNAARAGAAYGIMNSYTPDKVTAWENNVLATAKAEFAGQPGIDPAKLTMQRPVVQSVDPVSGDRYVEVKLTYDSFQTLVSWPGIPHTQKLTARVRMQSIR